MKATAIEGDLSVGRDFYCRHPKAPRRRGVRARFHDIYARPYASGMKRLELIANLSRNTGRREFGFRLPDSGAAVS